MKLGHQVANIVGASQAGNQVTRQDARAMLYSRVHDVQHRLCIDPTLWVTAGPGSSPSFVVPEADLNSRTRPDRPRGRRAGQVLRPISPSRANWHCSAWERKLLSSNRGGILAT
jgi:hypothetical protein